LVAALITRSLTTSDVIWGLTITGAITTVLSPLQDHMRRLLHIAELSWRAAAVSGVQFFGVVASLGVMLLIDAPVAIMPFGSLAIANALSLATGLILGDVFHQKRLEEPLRFWALAREGRWLLAQAMLPSVAHFAVATIIVALAGAEALGYTEAARVVAQPVLVFATGLTAVLAPRSMKAAMERDAATAYHVRRIYLGLVLAGGVLYLAAASTEWVLNPMQYLVPAAYVVPWLVAAKIISNMTTATMYLDVNELLGAQKAKPMAGIAIVTSPILVLVALTARTTEAFARPFGIMARDVVQIVWYRSILGRHFTRERKS
jgi:O-antigen/teichoic acid export membrane protein